MSCAHPLFSSSVARSGCVGWVSIMILPAGRLLRKSRPPGKGGQARKGWEAQSTVSSAPLNTPRGLVVEGSDWVPTGFRLAGGWAGGQETLLRPIFVPRFWISEGLAQALLVLRGEMFMSIGKNPDMLSQQILVGRILAGRLGVTSGANP